MVWGCRERPSYNYAAGGGFFDSQADTQIKHSLASDKNAYPEFPDTSTARRSVYSQSLHAIISSFKNILVSITALNLKCCQKKNLFVFYFFVSVQSEKHREAQLMDNNSPQLEYSFKLDLGK